MRRTNSLLLCLFAVASYAQQTPTQDQIKGLEDQLKAILVQQDTLTQRIERLKFEQIRWDLQAVGLPTIPVGEELVWHSAMALGYCEMHEQARWVAHIILPEVATGTALRSNDFRPDPAVKTGSAENEDYSIVRMNADSVPVFEAFGYDRGHLAPSADFKWSSKALSESYFYSNMSPQVAALNRGEWAKLEDKIRSYAIANKTQIIVMTGPVLTDNLPVIERGKNKVSIPAYYWKVAIDLANQRAIGFLMPNAKITYPLSTFVKSINEIEKETGLDLFSKLPDDKEEKLEQQKDAAAWLPEMIAGDVNPIYPPSLPPKHFNTVQANLYKNTGEKINVCGTVVAVKVAKKGNIILNLDKKYPNSIFTVMIMKDKISNFPYNPVTELQGKVICAKGEIMGDDKPMMFIGNENDIEFYNPD